MGSKLFAESHSILSGAVGVKRMPRKVGLGRAERGTWGVWDNSEVILTGKIGSV